MNHRRLLAAVFWLSAAIGHLMGQGSAVHTDIEAQTRLIAARNREVIVRAGLNGNRELIPALRGVAKRRRYSPYEEDGAENDAHVALARLDDVVQLQEVWCGLLQESDRPPLGTTSNIGGSFTIRAMLSILDGAGREGFTRGALKTPPTDVIHDPDVFALEILIMVAKGGATKYEPLQGNFEFENAKWRAWVHEHDGELRKRQPTGEGVDLSEGACRNGRPIRRRP